VYLDAEKKNRSEKRRPKETKKDRLNLDGGRSRRTGKVKGKDRERDEQWPAETGSARDRERDSERERERERLRASEHETGSGGRGRNKDGRRLQKVRKTTCMRLRNAASWLAGTRHLYSQIKI
jgi:hypothetical protein